MSYQLCEFLQIPPSELYAAARATRRQMEECMARLGLQLVALEQTGYHRERGCSSIVQFAVRNLQLSGKKAYELVRATRALLKLPNLAAAFASGEIGWGKIREITRVATPETETSWLAFALANDSDSVQRRVSMSPAAYRRRLGATGSGEVTHSVSSGTATSGLFEPESAAAGPGDQARVPAGPGTQGQASGPGAQVEASGRGDQVQASAGPIAQAQAPAGPGDQGRAPTDSDSGPELAHGVPEPGSEAESVPERPVAGRGSVVGTPLQASSPALERDLGEPLIQVVFRLTPAQLALYERAEERVRQRRGRRISRAEVLACLCEETLASATPRTRARLPVLVRVDASSGQGWLETRQGLYPASPEQVETALAGGKIAFYGSPPAQAQSGTAARPAMGSSTDTGPSTTPDVDATIRATAPGPALEAVCSNVAPDGPERRAGPVQVGSKRRKRRRPVSVPVLQALWLRSGGRCEVAGCGAGAPLHVHHEKAVSDGGDNSLAGLSLRCPACHGLHHEPDFRRRPEWQQARDNRRRRKSAKALEGGPGSAVGKPP